PLLAHVIATARKLKPGVIGQPEWTHYEKALVVKGEAPAARLEVLLEYLTPPSACAVADDPSILFKAASLHGDELFLCTQTEVLIHRLPDFARTHYLSLPCFNDVHHVRPTSQGTLLVAVTGLDLILEISRAGEILREWNVAPQETWQRFSRGVDYRTIVSTKPHLAHPNHVFIAEGEIWATRFEQRDAVCLTAPERRIDIGIGGPHDGIVHEPHVYFTTVNGHIVKADCKSGQVVQTFDLNRMSENRGPLGWCRGLLLLDEAHAVVGFSRLRPTKFRENIAWVKRWAKSSLGLSESVASKPTRIALYNLKAGRLLWEMNVEAAGMNAVFSIHLCNSPLEGGVAR
ncbi:MAG: hypothetical protein AAB354_10835, partial [candidate division KSB1 bacterium]